MRSIALPVSRRASRLNANPFAQLVLRTTKLRILARLTDPGQAFSTRRQVAKCTWSTCAATRKALAATVKLGFKPVLEGKNEESTT